MKTRRLQFLIVAALVVCNLPSAWAAFGPLVTMGPTVVLSDPSCASPADGQAVCAARGLGQTLVVNKWSGSSWGGWKPVAGTVTSNPSCSSDGSGRVVCAARNDTGGISATVYNGTVWGALTKVGGQITFEPSCAPLTAGKVLCVARNTIGGFTSTVFNGTTWSLFKTLKGSIIGPPGCGSDGAGAVVCLATSTTSIFNVVAAGLTAQPEHGHQHRRKLDHLPLFLHSLGRTSWCCGLRCPRHQHRSVCEYLQRRSLGSLQLERMVRSRWYRRPGNILCPNGCRSTWLRSRGF
jgi:hypothetical protein